MMQRFDHDLAFMLRYENVAWYEKGQVKILDRRIYPSQVRFEICKTYQEVAKAIADMVTQSAGPYTAAGMGMALAAYQARQLKEKDQLKFLEQAAYDLSHARPTTSFRMEQVTSSCLETAKTALKEGKKLDDAIFQRTLESLNRRYSRMDQVASKLVDMFPDRGAIMTQCFGETIVATMLRQAKKRKKEIKIFVPETRPYLQGARLTASVCKDQGFETILITDNMPAFVMANNKIDLFTSAADVICMDGHVVNKVGTYQIALVAKYHQIPYFVTGIPDRQNKDKTSIKIEYRNPEEVLETRGIKNTLEGVKGYYPAFDITPPHLVSGVVTDKAIYSPYDLNRYYKEKVEQYY